MRSALMKRCVMPRELVPNVRKQIADRLFMCALSYAAVSVTMTEPQSLSYILIHAGGWPAKLSMAVLALLTTVACIDTVINDCLPPRYTFHTAMKFRQGVWLFIAVTFAGHASVILRTNDGYGVALVYALYAIRCAAVSFLDLNYQYHDVIAKAKGEDGTTDHGVLDA